MTTQQRTLEEEFFANDRTDLDRAFWNRFVRALGVRFRSLDRIRIDWDQVSQQGIEVALARINEVLLPASQRIREVAELGFLVATSNTPQTLVEGQTLTFIVDEARRDLFTPGPFLAVTRLSTPDDYAVARLMFFDRATGVLDLRVEAFFGSPGPHDDWQISAVAGAVQAQTQILASVQVVRDETAGLRDETQAIKNATDVVKGQTEVLRDQTENIRAQANAETTTIRNQAQGFRNEAQGFRNEAEGFRNAFAALYRGPEAQPLAAGAFTGQLVYDTTDQVMKQWDGALWNPTVSTSIGGVVSQDFVATAGQTAFTVDGGFTALDVFVNGVSLVREVDYTLADPTFTLTVPLSAGARVQARGYKALDATDYPTREEADGRFVRRDAAQVISPAQRIQVLDNLGLGLDDDNLIINGDFRIAQRGTSHGTVGYGSLDRWRLQGQGGTFTLARSPWGPGNTLSGAYAMRASGLLTTTSQSAAGDFAFMEQRIEGLRAYEGQTITVLGWAWRASGSGNMHVSGVANHGTGGSPSSNFAIQGSDVVLSTTPQPFAVTLAIPALLTAVLGTNGDDFFGVRLWGSAGSDYTTFGINIGAKAAGIHFSGIHIRRGVWPASAAALYRPRHPAVELALCERYYEAGRAAFRWDATGVQNFVLSNNFKVTKRALPIMGGGAFTATNVSSQDVTSPTARSFRYSVVSAGAGGTLGAFDWTADAEL